MQTVLVFRNPLGRSCGKVNRYESARIRHGMLALFCGLLPFALPGCDKREPVAEIFPLEGKIEKVEATSAEGGRITVSYYSEKQKQTVVGVGMVTKETEIMINGAAAALKDLKEGDRVRGQVRVDKAGDKKTQTALKITVDRPKPTGG